MNREVCEHNKEIESFCRQCHEEVFMSTLETTVRLEKLRKHRECLNRVPQTVEREFEIARLDMEIIVIECETRAATAKRVLLFLDAWRKTGRFTAIREDGVRREASPVVTGVPVQDFWNVIGEAHTLANWSFGRNGPWVV